MTADLGPWEMLVRGPEGDEYAIGSGPLPLSILPDPADDGAQIVTIEMAQFIRSIADQVEAACLGGEVEGATWRQDADELYSPTHE